MHENLKFSFKGNRDYIHGTSLFNAVVEAAEKYGLGQGAVDVTFKYMIRNPVCVLELRPPVSDDAVVARLSDQSGENIILCINEASTTEPAYRQAFDELEVCRGAVLEDRCISQKNPHHSDQIELLVSLCKKMHQEYVDSNKKWVFSRYNGQYPIPDSEQVELRISKQVGTRLTCSDVFVNGFKIGDMYFS